MKVAGWLHVVELYMISENTQRSRELKKDLWKLKDSPEGVRWVFYNLLLR